MEQPAANPVYAHAKDLFARKDFLGALGALDEILGKEPENPAALALAGDIYAASGDVAQAMGHYGLAVQAAPQEDEYKRKFINIAGKIVFTQYNPDIAEILCLCLATPQVECTHAQVLWYTLVRSHPQFLALLKNAFEKPADLSFLLQPIFLLGIKRIVVCNMEFEGFMTALRRFLLERLEAPQRALSPDQYGALIEAVAQYCFNTDYIFNRTESEEKKVEALHIDLDKNAAARQDVFKTGLYACYEPFYKLKTAVELALLPGIKAQLEDYLDLQTRAAKIPSLTEITDALSLKVQEQYEEFPYPRWLELSRVAEKVPASHELSKAPQILIAGCGTGQEPLLLAKSYPHASILAIDLSRASLAYASKKAQELHIKNVEFCHADILKLGSLNRTFDVVSAIGSLVCMEDLEGGWRILTGLLKPGGIMRIGLYSAFARRSVRAAWDEIRKGNYANTAAGMRSFRKDSGKLLNNALRDKIFDARDSYHLNMYRDFLFHVKEHQSTLPQVKKMLEDLNLEFVEMSAPAAVRQHYQKYFPTDLEGKNLDNWHRMEEANPDMFTGMYIFWCKKKA